MLMDVKRISFPHKELEEPPESAVPSQGEHSVHSWNKIRFFPFSLKEELIVGRGERKGIVAPLMIQCNFPTRKKRTDSLFTKLRTN